MALQTKVLGYSFSQECLPFWHCHLQNSYRRTVELSFKICICLNLWCCVGPIHINLGLHEAHQQVGRGHDGSICYCFQLWASTVLGIWPHHFNLGFCGHTAFSLVALISVAHSNNMCWHFRTTWVIQYNLPVSKLLILLHMQRPSFWGTFTPFKDWNVYIFWRLIFSYHTCQN